MEVRNRINPMKRLFFTGQNFLLTHYIQCCYCGGYFMASTFEVRWQKKEGGWVIHTYEFWWGHFYFIFEVGGGYSYFISEEGEGGRGNAKQRWVNT